jgi:hypothetical protein
VTPLRPRAVPRYSDTNALNDIHTILTADTGGRDALAEIADVLTRAGRPPFTARDIEVHTTETAQGWPVACTHAGDTTVSVRQQPPGPGLLAEITTGTEAEYRQLTVTLDGHRLHPPRRAGSEPA